MSLQAILPMVHVMQGGNLSEAGWLIGSHTVSYNGAPRNRSLNMPVLKRDCGAPRTSRPTQHGFGMSRGRLVVTLTMFDLVENEELSGGKRDYVLKVAA